MTADIRNCRFPVLAAATVGCCLLLAADCASGADGSWSVNAGGNWSAPGNWAGGTIATGVDATAYFTNAITADRVVFQDYAALEIGKLVFGSPSSNWWVTNNTIVLTNSTVPEIAVNANNATISSVISGGQGFTKTGGGYLRLTATNTFSGGITTTGGRIGVISGGALGTGTVTMNSGSKRVVLAPGVTVANDITVNAGVSPDVGRGAIEGTGIGSTLTGAIILNASTTDGGHFFGDQGLNINGPINASVNVNSREGTVIIRGGGAYSSFSIGSGTVKVGADNGLCPTATLTVATAGGGNGRFDLNGYNQTLAGLARGGAGTSAIVTNSSATNSTLTLNIISGISTYSAPMGGKIAIVKTGAGTMTFGSTSACESAATVSNGALVFAAGNVGAWTSLTVEAGATCRIETVSGVLWDLGTVTLNSTGSVYGKLYLGSGVNETVGSLYFNSSAQSFGAWGASGSTATYTNDDYFSGAGTLTVFGGPAVNNASGATNVGMTGAWLNGNLISTGGAPATAIIFWGLTNEGESFTWQYNTNAGAMGEGPFTAEIVGLTGETRYYYRCYATNSLGADWADATESFRTLSDPTRFGYRMKICFSGYGRDKPLTNFPALVIFGTNLVNFSYNRFASPWDAGDLRFWNSNQAVQLNHEIEEWNTNGNSYVWAQVPELVGTNTEIWAYWGNSSATEAPDYTTNGATWDGGYNGVWHLNSMPSGEIPDSTANRKNGANVGTVTAAGLMANCGSFQTNTYVTLLPSVAGSGLGSVSAWVWTTRDHSAAQMICYGTADGGDGFGTDRELHINLATDERGQFLIEGGSSDVSITGGPNCADGIWHHLAATWDINGNAILYVDGVERVSTAHNAYDFVCSNYQRLGRPYSTGSGARLYAGLMDEVRLSSVARSSNWVWACYMNQGSNQFFNVYGTVQESGRGTVLRIR